MKYNTKQPTIASFVALFAAGYFVWQRSETFSLSGAKLDVTSRDSETEVKSFRPSISPTVNIITESESELPRAISLPLGAIVAKHIEPEIQTLRVPTGDKAILALGGLHVDHLPEITKTPEILHHKRLESMTAKDWQEQPNLLVNEIRAARGFQVPLAQVEALLAGKDLYGWTEGQRNWIGDELMIMLRQEVPQEAYRIFQQVLADKSAPDAMRDYSIQHISHMAAANQIGAEGVAVIRSALDSGDPIYASTALISLHRLSASQPQFISPKQVSQLAQQRLQSADQRMQLTAKAITEVRAINAR